MRALARGGCSTSADASSGQMQCKCGTRGHQGAVVGESVSAEVDMLVDEDADGGVDVKEGGREFSKATSGISEGDGRKMVGRWRGHGWTTGGRWGGN